MSWRECSCVGASTSALGCMSHCDPAGRAASSVCFRSWSIGSRYAVIFPEPVSDARRTYRYGSWLSFRVKRYLRDDACMGVGFAFGGMAHVSSPGRSGGDANSVGSSPDTSVSVVASLNSLPSGSLARELARSLSCLDRLLMCARRPRSQVVRL
ncbi:hypothetical protein FIBSPDRAFT_1053960 [Athelia psychrophila]|uniref:Uncharacterized protein n=1 Tax=Athelia psychrophila TaxID=1759441 RepID=A0A167W4D8_9AGAM|nr:hypothetical protein FIBSPDRAFT_1053960 [Fibularhizoctonia sp. CBS 109695]